MIRVQMMCLNFRDVTTLPTYRNTFLRLRAHRGLQKGEYNTSLWMEKIRIIRTKKILGLPCGFFFRMAAPLNLVEENHPSPHDPILLT
jgi:hypothetical protein